MTRPARLLILQRARALIEDERDWCPGDLARDARGFSVSPIDSNADGAILAAAYQFTGDLDRAKEIAMVAMRPVIGPTSLTHVNDWEGHAAILDLFDLAIAAQ
jgi:hypothetical protein